MTFEEEVYILLIFCEVQKNNICLWQRSLKYSVFLKLAVHQVLVCTNKELLPIVIVSVFKQMRFWKVLIPRMHSICFHQVQVSCAHA